MPSHVVLNNTFGDDLYDADTLDDNAALYAYAENGKANQTYELVAPRSSLNLSGRHEEGYEQPSVKGPPVPRRSASIQQVKVVEIQHINLWPVWVAIGIIGIIAIAALAQSMAPGAVPRTTPAAAASKLATTTAGPLPLSSVAGSAPTVGPSPTLPPAGNCYCTSKTMTFAATDPGPCYVVADGNNDTPNLLQNGGLYIRPGPPAVAGIVIEQATAVNGLAVNVSTRRNSEWPDIYGEQCDGNGGKTLETAHLSNYLTAHWPRCSNGLNSTAALEGDAETRPPSMYLVPYMCR